MSEASDNKDEWLAKQMEYFGERINRVFAYFFCVLEFENDDNVRADPTFNPRAWSLKTIENACLDTTLLALRDLDDFFIPRKPNTKPDDVRASDFGYEGSHTFLTQSERENINKLVAHTTTVGADSQRFRWDTLELATKGISQTVEFLSWVEKEYGPANFNLYTAAVFIRSKTQSDLHRFSSMASEQRGGRARNPQRSVAEETFDSLWAYCTSDDRALPKDWQRLYDMLANKRQTSSGGWQPALPLILAAWDVTTFIEKKLRFKEHIQWASDNNQLTEIGCYLRSLPDDQWYRFDEL